MADDDDAPVGSVRLGTSSTLKFHAFLAVSTSCAASRPFKNTPTVDGVNSGAARPSSRSSGASARAETTSGAWQASLSRRRFDSCRQDIHSDPGGDPRLADDLAQERALAGIALDQGDAGRCGLRSRPRLPAFRGERVRVRGCGMLRRLWPPPTLTLPHSEEEWGEGRVVASRIATTRPGKPAPEPRSIQVRAARREGQELRRVGEMAVPDVVQRARAPPG